MSLYLQLVNDYARALLDFSRARKPRILFISIVECSQDAGNALVAQENAGHDHGAESVRRHFSFELFELFTFLFEPLQLSGTMARDSGSG